MDNGINPVLFAGTLSNIDFRRMGNSELPHPTKELPDAKTVRILKGMLSLYYLAFDCTKNMNILY